LVNLRNRRLIPFVKLGKSIRYNPDRVAKALEKLTVEEHTQPPKGAKRHLGKYVSRLGRKITNPTGPFTWFSPTNAHSKQFSKKVNCGIDLQLDQAHALTQAIR
jgi:hypothetical protein